MQTQQEFGFKQLFNHIVGDMVKAIAVRNGESRQQQFARTQAAIRMILDFAPRDTIEAMLAGHCVMLHEVMTDSVGQTLRGEMDSIRKGTRNNLVALNKSFILNLDHLGRCQMRHAEGSRDVLEEARAEAEIAARTQPEEPAPVQPADAPPSAEVVHLACPSPEAIAACRANPEAMAALDANDPIRFARAMGVEEPSEAYAAAAASRMAELNPRTRNNQSAESGRG